LNFRIFALMNELKHLLEPYPRVFVVYDRKVESKALELTEGLKALAIDAGESHKTLSQAEAICRWLMNENAGRDALLLTIGGGFTSDIGGFAAGIYKRGIRFATVPTTLLAMVDAAIGGKTGANLDGYKNMIGVFNTPEFICLIPEFIETLSEEELRAGKAELLKTFLIQDGENYTKAVQSILEGGDLLPFIKKAAAIKQSIVDRDPRENGLRKILNLGHSWAHAIEWKSQESISHGDAVAMGIIRAARLSENLNIAPKGLTDSIAADFKACGLPTECPYSDEQLLQAIRKDKKAGGKGIDIILLENIGKAVIKNISADDLLEH